MLRLFRVFTHHIYNLQAVFVCVRAQVSKALPERQLEMEALLRELESLRAQLDELCVWASSTRTRLEDASEEPPTQVAETSGFVLLFGILRCH